MLLKHPELGLEESAIETYFFGKEHGKGYLTCFLDQHPKLVSELSSNFNKQRIK